MKSSTHPQEIQKWKDAVRELVEQFSCCVEHHGRLCFTTGGLSALEMAFEMLDWDDPHPCPERECEQGGCHSEATTGTQTPKGYKRLCFKHFKKVNP